MTCRDFEAWWSERAVAVADVTSAAHPAGCRRCAARVADYLATIRIVRFGVAGNGGGTWRPAPVDATFVRRVLTAREAGL